MKLSHAALAFLVVAGCSGGSTVTGGNAALGVASFEIDETSTMLTIVGYDAKHESVVDLKLRKGFVEIPDEGLAGEGKEITFNVDHKPITHTSVGTMTVRLPLMPSMVHFNAFVTDAQLSPVLAKWGVTFVSPGAAGGEQQLSTFRCGHDPNMACGATDCFQNSDDSYEEVCCGSNGDGNGNPALVVRSCSTPFGTSACGTNGPGGCAPCYNFLYSSSCTLFTWPSENLDNNGPNCTWDYDCQGVHFCSTCDRTTLDSNGFGYCNPQDC